MMLTHDDYLNIMTILDEAEAVVRVARLDSDLGDRVEWVKEKIREVQHGKA